MRDQAPCKIAMRIDDRAAAATENVLHGERFQQRFLSRAGLANGVDMRQAVRLFDTEGMSRVPVIGRREV